MPQNQLRRRRNGLEVSSEPSLLRSPDGARARSEGTDESMQAEMVARGRRRQILRRHRLGAGLKNERDRLP